MTNDPFKEIEKKEFNLKFSFFDRLEQSTLYQVVLKVHQFVFECHPLVFTLT